MKFDIYPSGAMCTRFEGLIIDKMRKFYCGRKSCHPVRAFGIHDSFKGFSHTFSLEMSLEQ